jgi:hypothetical protein
MVVRAGRTRIRSDSHETCRTRGTAYRAALMEGNVGERDEWKFGLGVRARGADLCILHKVGDYSTWWRLYQRPILDSNDSIYIGELHWISIMTYAGRLY